MIYRQIPIRDLCIVVYPSGFCNLQSSSGAFLWLHAKLEKKHRFNLGVHELTGNSALRPLLAQISLTTVFTRISAAALTKFFASQKRGLFEGSAYLKIGRDKEIFSFNLTVYFLSV